MPCQPIVKMKIIALCLGGLVVGVLIGGAYKGYTG
jgi:hypothetical protein